MMHSGILLIGLLVSASIVGPFFYYFGRGDDLANHLRGSQVINVSRRLLPRDDEGGRTGQVLEGVKTSGWWQDATGVKFWQEGPAALGWQAWKAHGVLGLWWGRTNATDAFFVIVAAVGDDVPAELDNEGAEASLGFGLGVDDASSGWESVLLAQDDGQTVGDLSHEHDGLDYSDDEADPLPDDEVETERLKSEYDAYYSQDQYEDDYYGRSSSSPSAPARLYDDASTPVKDDNGAEAWEARN